MIVICQKNSTMSKRLQGFQKGNQWNLGKKFPGRKLSDATKKKLSERMKDKKLTEEHKRKLVASHKGIPLSMEHKVKIGLGLKGKKHSKETKQKISNSHRGEKSYLWKGGISPIMIRIRICFEYRQWRSDIFQRDNWTCQICGIVGGELNADHFPKSFSDIFREYNIKTFKEAMTCEELWNINNGRTLCEPCHRKTSTFGGRSKKGLKMKLKILI